MHKITKVARQMKNRREIHKLWIYLLVQTKHSREISCSAEKQGNFTHTRVFFLPEQHSGAVQRSRQRLCSAAASAAGTPEGAPASHSYHTMRNWKDTDTESLQEFPPSLPLTLQLAKKLNKSMYFPNSIYCCIL